MLLISATLTHPFTILLYQPPNRTEKMLTQVQDYSCYLDFVLQSEREAECSASVPHPHPQLGLESKACFTSAGQLFTTTLYVQPLIFTKKYSQN